MRDCPERPPFLLLQTLGARHVVGGSSHHESCSYLAHISSPLRRRAVSRRLALRIGMGEHLSDACDQTLGLQRLPSR